MIVIFKNLKKLKIMRHICFLVVFTVFLFSSCASFKLATTDKSKNLKQFSLGIIENFNLTPDMLKEVQFYSGPDTIVLQKITRVGTGSVSDGVLRLVGVGHVKIMPNTPCVVIPKGIILGKNKQVQEILVSCSDSDDDKNYLSFMPANDEFGTFSLSEADSNSKVKNLEGQSLMVELFYIEQQVKIEPGRFIGQKKNNSEEFIPNKKLVRNNDYD